MTHTGLHEKNFEADIEQYLLTKGGYTKGSQATYDKEKAIDLDTLIRFVKDSQPKAWERFERKYGNSAKTQNYTRKHSEVWSDTYFAQWGQRLWYSIEAMLLRSYVNA